MTIILDKRHKWKLRKSLGWYTCITCGLTNKWALGYLVSCVKTVNILDRILGGKHDR